MTWARLRQSVANTVKRVVIIIAGSVVFNKPLTQNGRHPPPSLWRPVPRHAPSSSRAAHRTARPPVLLRFWRVTACHGACHGAPARDGVPRRHHRVRRRHARRAALLPRPQGPPPPSPRPHNPPIPPPAPKPGPPPAARPRPPRRWHMLMGQVTATRTRPDSRMYDGIRAALPGDASPLARVRRPEPARPPPRLDRRTGWCRRGSRDTLGSNAACAPPSVTWF